MARKVSSPCDPWDPQIGREILILNFHPQFFLSPCDHDRNCLQILQVGILNFHHQLRKFSHHMMMGTLFSDFKLSPPGRKVFSSYDFQILRVGGRIIISVWSMEQRHRRFESQVVISSISRINSFV